MREVLIQRLKHWGNERVKTIKGEGQLESPAEIVGLMVRPFSFGIQYICKYLVYLFCEKAKCLLYVEWRNKYESFNDRKYDKKLYRAQIV